MKHTQYLFIVVLQIYHQERSFSPCSNIQVCSLVNKIGARKKECSQEKENCAQEEEASTGA